MNEPLEGDLTPAEGVFGPEHPRVVVNAEDQGEQLEGDLLRVALRPRQALQSQLDRPGQLLAPALLQLRDLVSHRPTDVSELGRTRHEETTSGGRIRDALHGDDDEIISIATAKESFTQLTQKKNPLGKFHSIANLKHTMNDEARAWLKNKIQDVLNDPK